MKKRNSYSASQSSPDDQRKVGEILQRARERKGITLTKVEEDIHVRAKYLQALEYGDYEELPGEVYVKGFLKNYARYLDLDPENILKLYRRERWRPPYYEAISRRASAIPHRTLQITRGTLVTLLILGGVIGFIGYLLYEFLIFTQPPKLVILQPRTDLTVNSDRYTVEGKTVPDPRQFTITVNDKVIPDVQVDKNGDFKHTITLKTGQNWIVFSVTDQAGRSTEEKRTINFPSTKEESPPPTTGSTPEATPEGIPANTATPGPEG